jgi:hypothetical protein
MISSRLASLFMLASPLTLAACGPAAETPDAGTDAFLDESGLDGGRRDAGPDAFLDESSLDGGPRDAGADAPFTMIDAFLEGLPDSGTDAATIGEDAFVVDDAFVAPDAFLTPDAFVARDAFVTPDAFRSVPACTAPDLAVPSAPTPPALVISEIDPGTFIELYNTTSSDIALSSVPYQFCSPFVYAAVASLGAGVTVPAHGYANLPWPAGFSDTEAGGEVSLYTSGAYADPTAVMSFVCWGTNPHGTRKSTAETGGRWSGACAGAITAGRSIARRPSTTGTLATDWATDATPSPETCGP